MYKNKLYASPSQLGQFAKCSLKWYFQRTLRKRFKLTTKATSYLSIGTAVHKAIETDYETAFTTGELAPIDLIQDIAADAFDLAAEDTMFEPREDPGELKDDAISLAAFNHTDVAPHVVKKGIVAIEDWLNIIIPLDEGTEVHMWQRPDCVTKKGIVDNKTSERRIGNIKDPKDKTATRVDTQLSAYAYGYRLKYGKDPEEVVLNRLLRTKDGPRKEILTDTRTDGDYARFVARTKRIAERMLTVDVYPIDDPLTCRYCPFKKVCWEGAGGNWSRYVAEPELVKTEMERLSGEILTEDKFTGGSS